MEPNDGQATDASSIKPVSSLRSQFENLTSPKSSSTTSSAPPPVRPKSFNLLQLSTAAATAPRDPPETTSSRTSFDSSTNDKDVQDMSRAKRRPPSPPKPRRPRSALPPSPNISTPEVNVTSPTSPPKPLVVPKGRSAQHGALTPASGRSEMPHERPSGHFRIPSRSSNNSPIPNPGLSSVNTYDVATNYPPRQSSLQHDTTQGPSKAPPPVNREAKPRGREIIDGSVQASGSRAIKSLDRKVSPFSTPPSSDESSPAQSPPPLPIHSKPKPPSVQQVSSDTPRNPTTHHPAEVRPGLPPRRNVIPSRSQDTLASMSTKPSALTQGFSNKSQTGTQSPVYDPTPAPGYRNLTPPPRLSSSDNRRTTQSSRNITSIHTVEHEERRPTPDITAPNWSDYPDSSQANRRHPYYSDGPRAISTGYDPRLLDVCGEYVCTTGTMTRVWSLLTGKLLLSIAHGESIKATALCFCPSRKIDQEGTRIWLGTNWGDMLEVNMSSKKIVASNSQSHHRYEVVKMYRCGTEIWSLDSEGKLFVWPADTSGSPSLDNSVSNGRLGRRPTASLAVGEELWMAYGKDVKIYKPSAQSDNAQPMNSQSTTSQQGAGDITCAGALSDKVYFGHSDGKISIYDKKTYEFLELISVSIYKITSIVGIGKYLWTGLTTGMMYVYDMSQKPWTIKKDWRAHGSPVVALSADQCNIWKLDRFMVLSLGVDNMISIWDGMLEDDWLEDDMKLHNAEFCNFRDVSALVLTWNTGASTPADLRYDEEDSNFFRELFLQEQPPDIIAFGLQELVDLEDKALTAKSFFKSRQKDSYGSESLSSVYRAWRDYLGQCLDYAMPVDESYKLLHTASLVGLFSCIFVKSSQLSKINDVQAVEIKTGMGGLHGNKGAIAVRCVIDDSSLCFVNCHLAAGQTKTMERNNDVAVILESSAFPSIRSSAGVFVGGGDGSMILDNETCILSGDLNYRIETMTRDLILSALKADNLTKLLERDQLSLSRRKNPGFRLRAFRELPITFHPTYKYDVGTDTYDTSEKRRSPAWCDRIMCRGSVTQLDYQRHEVRVSDHRPLSASFKIEVKKIDRRKREECQKQSMQRYIKYKDSVSSNSKLNYLTSVFGLSLQEAERELASIREKRAS